MAKIHKVEFYIVDANSFYDTEEKLICDIDRGLYEGCIKHFKWKTSKEFEWDDDLDINYKKCSEEDCEKYFTI